MKRSVPFLLILIATLATASAHATVFEVQIIDFEFVPATLTVAAGDSIHWTNDGLVQHTVDSGVPCTPDGEFDSGTLNPGDDFVYVVDEKDVGLTIPYFCEFHCDMGMTGSYTVEESTATDPISWGEIKAQYR